ncbi:uncharacterized protein SPPG_02190 [Spizellomyces punctatus DAOM BR117]|uniref:SH3 domain-containing protein n=1 Tax=Spizellomyces punctatus (strain DAOM BR117) TaxID=645134 RepID=A0A0L0HQP5_SPIPD|nr:uncharacterized protein SPPG_02190 [Spizellomyces punctatus DAOM BR117]KND03129.1 hypothetical protein SPPG_02190 [Spizellomyces punctatus DAOM BR117]|eukprot:XP_016611168.1 hypothetical protein SPPG_02190 [Spizellomyces punctatus DAOM BR117]
MEQTTIIIILSTGCGILLLVLIVLAVLLRKRNASSAAKSQRYVHLEDASTLPMDKVRVVAEEDDVKEAGHRSGANSQLPSFLVDQEELPSYTVIKAFEKRKRDDMILTVGDKVTISMTFTDGWCHGYNHTTHTMGMFPISSVAVIDRKHSKSKPRQASNEEANSPESNSSATLTSPETPSSVNEVHPPTQKPEKGKLLFSMVPPEQAMEIVAESLSAERRAHYFETMLRDAKATPSPKSEELDPLENQLRASMEGAAGQESRAKLAWRKLRVGWKDAVRKQLSDGYDDWLAQKEKFDIWGFMADNYRVDNGEGWSGSDDA